MRPSFSSDAAKWVLPLLSSVVFGLVGVTLSWAKEWSSNARKVRLLDQATKRLDFWTKWLSAVKANEIDTTEEQTHIAQTELTRVATIVAEASRFWPMPHRWTRTEFRERWLSLGLFRRAFLFYRPYNQKARWMKRVLSALTMGWLVLLFYPLVVRDNRPDSTITYVPFSRTTVGTPTCPPSWTQAQCAEGRRTTLGAQRSEYDWNVVEFLLLLTLGRGLLFLYEWDSLTPWSENPEWLRRYRAENILKVAQAHGGHIPPGIFNADTAELETELTWVAAIRGETAFRDPPIE